MKTFSPLVAAGLIVVASCASPNSSGTPSPTPEPHVAQTVTMLDTKVATWQVGFSPLADLNKTRDVTISIPNGGSNYFVLLTNVSQDPASQPNITSFSPDKASSRSLSGSSPAFDLGGKHAPVTLRDRGVLPQLPRVPHSRSALPTYTYDGFAVNNTTDFIDPFWNTSHTAVPTNANLHPSTLRAQVTVGSAPNKHVVNVWVADDCWAGTGTTVIATNPNNGKAWANPDHPVTQTMVDNLANSFLTAGTTVGSVTYTAGSDIYSWVTTLVGKEWPSTGAPSYQNGTMVDSEGNIHIFVTNLNPGSTSASVLEGFFYSPNNDPSALGSNKKVLFAVDADTLANPSDNGSDSNSTWAVTDRGPKEILSTLAHEFQHMIHFYQKQVTHNLAAQTDTWINEMASMMVEDLVSDKLAVEGPRGILGTNYEPTAIGQGLGRLGFFDFYHEQIPLTGWFSGDYVLLSYGNAYAFGAWLMRNYGGPKLLADLVTNQYTDVQAVEHAVHTDAAGLSQTYATLVRDWGVAVQFGGYAPYTDGSRPGFYYSNYQYDSNFQLIYPPFSYSVVDDAMVPHSYALGSIDLRNYTFPYLDNNGGHHVYSGVYTYDYVPNGSTVAAGATLIDDVGFAFAPYSKTVSVPPNVVVTVVFTPY